MKITLQDPPEPERTYPYIGQSDTKVVLFWGKNSGVCLISTLGSKEVQIGFPRCDWLEWQFEPMKGSITLSND